MCVQHFVVCIGKDCAHHFCDVMMISFLFQLYICLISIHAIYMCVQHFVVCIGKDWKGKAL